MSTTRFNPPARLSAPKVDGGKVPVRDCPVAPRRLPMTKGQIIWPAVMGIAFLGMMAMVLTQPGLRSGPMGFVSLLMPIMMLSSFAAMFMGGRFSGADNKSMSPQVLEEERRVLPGRAGSDPRRDTDRRRAPVRELSVLAP